jgi:arabinan endo-1,5-alpha-L-arabinosidase
MMNPKCTRMIDLKSLPLFFMLVLLPVDGLYALHGNTGAHDPTAIQKCGNTYWIFTTGNGISSLYSRDLVSWTSGRTPFSRNSYPAWINTLVPGFDGHFWAPECIYMNGKYHLYYSCSTWGSITSCIGLATNTTLDPSDPNFLWEDQGVVVSSSPGSEANCIDPSVFQDENGDYYMTYGSYFGGIRLVELDSLSGMISGSYHYPVASGSCEASYVIPHGESYYLFINRGTCCSGVNSTYHIQVGRSLSPVGPFLDKDGVNLNGGGGSTIFSTNGSLIGPGHVGYYVEDGETWVTFHYYDGDRNGAPTLGIGTMLWEEDWPVITSNFIEEGDYVLVNHNSQLVMQAENPIEPGGTVSQGTYIHEENQKLHLTPVGNGYYSIAVGADNLVVEPEGCSTSSGVLLNMGTDDFMPCEHWKFERTSLLEYVISSRAGNNVIDVPPPAFEEGTQLQTSIYSGVASHYWAVMDTSMTVGNSRVEEVRSNGFFVVPNPSRGECLTIQFDHQPSDRVVVMIFSMDGRQVYNENHDAASMISIKHQFPAGIYSVSVVTGETYIEKKMIIL